jgi:hypothetical protein
MRLKSCAASLKAFQIVQKKGFEWDGSNDCIGGELRRRNQIGWQSAQVFEAQEPKEDFVKE